MSESLQPHELYSPWNSLGQNTGVGSLSLLQGIFTTQGLNPGLPHCRQTLYQLSHKGSPIKLGRRENLLQPEELWSQIHEENPHSFSSLSLCHSTLEVDASAGGEQQIEDQGRKSLGAEKC